MWLVARTSLVYKLGKLTADGKNGSLQVQFGLIRGVNMDSHAVQGGFEGFLGSRVEHLVSNGGRVGIPGEKNEFGGGSAVGGFKIQINESVAAVVFREGFAKVFVRLCAFSFGFNDNGLFVLDGINNKAQFFALLQFEGVEGGRDFFVDGYSGGLFVVECLLEKI